MTTALDIVTSAIEHLGASAIGEPVDAGEADDALRALNKMLDTWNSESLTIYTTQPQVFPFVASKASYTLGVGGDFNIPRPVKIETVTIRSSGNIDFPCEIISEQEYSAIPLKTISSTLPYKMYDDGDFPLKNLIFYPVPADASYSAVLWVWQSFSTATVLTSTMSFPPGYTEALEYNLAVRIAPKYGRPVSADLRQLAMDSKAQIQRANTVATMKEMAMPVGMTRKSGYTLQDFLSGV